MTRPFIAGLVGIAALLASSIGVIAVLTRDAAPPAEELPEVRARGTPTDGASSAAAPPSAGPWAPVPPAAAWVVPEIGADADSRPPSRSADNALSPATHHARISFRGQLTSGIAEMQKRVSRCRLSDASLKLDLETTAEGIRVLDVQAEPGAGTSEKDVACARSALKGKVIPPPSAEPGRRWQMPLVVRSSR